MEAVFQERFERWKDSVRNSLLKILGIKPINTDNNGWDLRQLYLVVCCSTVGNEASESVSYRKILESRYNIIRRLNVLLRTKKAPYSQVFVC